jgi:coproporphyrinogen III oxidase-like Fe-S oxidoreductase
MILEAFLTTFMRRQARLKLSFPIFPRGWGGAELPPPEGREHLLYLHVPYCEELCKYCSFNRVRLDTGQASQYFAALRAEMRLYKDLGYRFDGVYVGGGTPTVLPGELAAVLRLARELWPIRSLSVETNPNHLTPAVLDLLVECGVDRLSIGVQTFDDGLLAAMRRYHRYGSGSDIRRNLAAARGRFATLNVDLIFNFAGQTESMLRSDLQVLNELAVDQITYYPLMSPRPLRGPFTREKRFYRVIREALGPAYRPATAWCFSRKPGGRQPAGGGLGDEYIVTREEYAGLGSGSFGYLGGRLYANTFSLPQYIELLGRGELPVAAQRRFSRRDRLRYDFLMKLFGGRLDLGELEARHGPGAERRLDSEIAFFRSVGALRREERTLVLTDEGYYVWVVLMREFFTGLNRLRAAGLVTGE